jgi:hypothetical protein
MRTLIYSLATVALLTAAVFVWSRAALVSSQATTATGGAQIPQQGALISPFDMMVKYSKPLPTQAYDAH